jgi:hypothetical protein
MPRPGSGAGRHKGHHGFEPEAYDVERRMHWHRAPWLMALVIIVSKIK